MHTMNYIITVKPYRLLYSYYKDISKIKVKDTEAKVMLVYVSRAETDAKLLPSLQKNIKRFKIEKSMLAYCQRSQILLKV